MEIQPDYLVIHKLNGKIKEVPNGFHKDAKDDSYLCFDGMRTFTIPWGIRYEMSNKRNAVIKAWGELSFTTPKNIDLRQNFCDKFDKDKAWVKDDEYEYLVVYQIICNSQNGQVHAKGISIVLSELIRNVIESHMQEVFDKFDASSTQQKAALLQQLCCEQLNEISQKYFMTDCDYDQPRFVAEWTLIENQ